MKLERNKNKSLFTNISNKADIAFFNVNPNNLYTKKQFQILKDFADKNDALFDLEIATTDSFKQKTGYHYFELVEKDLRTNAGFNYL